MTVIQVILKGMYGRTLLYPANDAAHALANIAGTVTLEPYILRIAKHQLGMEIQTLQQDAAIVAELVRPKP